LAGSKERYAGAAEKANLCSVKNPIGVLEDLDEYRNVLAQAKAVGARWNLQVVF
jgi:hypothetical protein